MQCRPGRLRQARIGLLLCVAAGMRLRPPVGLNMRFLAFETAPSKGGGERRRWVYVCGMAGPRELQCSHVGSRTPAQSRLRSVSRQSAKLRNGGRRWRRARPIYVKLRAAVHKLLLNGCGGLAVTSLYRTQGRKGRSSTCSQHRGGTRQFQQCGPTCALRPASLTITGYRYRYAGTAPTAFLTSICRGRSGSCIQYIAVWSMRPTAHDSTSASITTSATLAARVLPLLAWAIRLPRSSRG